MADDLNIRAAKALGWEHYTDHPTTQWMIPCDWAREHVKTPTTYDSDLKFTTSYDWAMLGVSKIEDLNIPYGELEAYYSVIHSSKTATPKEITQAWVEVLEAI